MVILSDGSVLAALEELCILKDIKEQFGGGKKAFTVAEIDSFVGADNLETFLTSSDRLMILQSLLTTIRVEKSESVGDLQFNKDDNLSTLIIVI